MGCGCLGCPHARRVSTPEHSHPTSWLRAAGQQRPGNNCLPLSSKLVGGQTTRKVIASPSRVTAWNVVAAVDRTVGMMHEAAQQANQLCLPTKWVDTAQSTRLQSSSRHPLSARHCEVMYKLLNEQLQAALPLSCNNNTTHHCHAQHTGVRTMKCQQQPRRSICSSGG